MKQIFIIMIFFIFGIKTDHFHKLGGITKYDDQNRYKKH